jgi:transcriptional regulator with XRE-family HTH domain
VERGEYNVSLQNVAKLAKALKVPIADLFGGQTAPAVLTEPERLRLHILKLLQRQSATRLRTILNIVKELTKGRS